MPNKLSVMISAVAGNIYATHKVKSGSFVPEFRIAHPVAIVHGFTEDNISFGLFCKAVSRQLFVLLKALVIAVTICVIERCNPGKSIRKAVGIVKLQVLLNVIIRMIPIINRLAGSIVGHNTLRVVGPVFKH